MILIQVDIMAYYYYVTQAAGNLWQNTTCHGVTILAQAPPSESAHRDRGTGRLPGILCDSKVISRALLEM